MNTINYIFFETYKKLEKICNEIFSATNGVTQYIDEMENVSFSVYCNIPNWKSDLSTLKKLRHIRNQIAHNEGSFSQNLCTQNDIDWLNNFHMRIMEQTDPLSLLRKKGTSEKPKHPISENTLQPDFNETTSSDFITKTILTALLLVGIIMAFCLIFGYKIAAQLFHL